MFDEMRLAGLADPRYEQTSGSVRLVLRTDPVERELEARLPPAARDIARLLRDAGRLGTGEIVLATGRSRPWVISQLRQLEDARVIQRVGKSPKDPSGLLDAPGPLSGAPGDGLPFKTRSHVRPS